VIFTGLTPLEIIEEGFDPGAAFRDAGFGTLSPEDYFGPAGKAAPLPAQGGPALLAAPGGLAASGAGTELARLIKAAAPLRIEALIPEGLREGIITARREKGAARFIILASQDGAAADAKVLFRDCPDGSAFYELDLETGAVYPAAAEQGAGGFVIDAPLSPWTARIFALAPGGEQTSPRISALRAFTRPPAKTLRLSLDLDREMKVSLRGGNVYRLEDLSVSIGGGPGFPSRPNTFIEHLKESGGLKAAQVKFGGGFGIPPRLSVNYPLQAAYHFEFTLAADPAGMRSANGGPFQIRLLRDRMAIMGGHSVILNRRELSPEAWEPCRVYDQNNIAADITACLKNGLNTLDISVTATEDWHGLSDPLYLLGDFGVLRRGDRFIIGAPPAMARPSAKAVEGFPFYSGVFTFETSLMVENPGAYDRFTIEIPGLYRIYECVGLAVRGQDLGARTFSPYLWQGPASLLQEGANPLRLSIANTLGNMLEGCYYDYEAQKTVYIRGGNTDGA
jgi:hypothetical protein